MNEWHFYLDEVLEAYNSNCYKATGFSVSDLLLSPFFSVLYQPFAI